MNPSFLPPSSSLLSFLRHTLLALTLLCSLHVWGASGDAYTFTSTSGNYDENVSFSSATYNNANAQPPAFASPQLRIYANNMFIVTPAEGVTITEIHVETSSSSNVGNWSVVEGGGSVSVSDKYWTWTGSATSALKLTTSENSRMKIMTITYTKLEVPAKEWTITWSISGDDSKTTQVEDGTKPVPPIIPNKMACDDTKEFIGWTTTPINEATDTKPEYWTTALLPVAEADETYYALFAVVPEGGGVEETTLTEDFESFEAGTKYDAQQTYTNATTHVGWLVNSGTVSTSSKITGNNSIAMRYYSSATTNYPYLQTTTPIVGLKQVSFNLKASTANGAEWTIQVYWSENGTTWGNAETLSVSGSVKAFTCNAPSGAKYVKWDATGTTINKKNAQATIDDIVFVCGSVSEAKPTGYITECTTTPSTPQIILSATTLSGFSYVVGEGPSATQTLTIKGRYLSGEDKGGDYSIKMTMPFPFEMSLAQESEEYQNMITLYDDNKDGFLEKTIYVRLAEGHEVGSCKGGLYLNTANLALVYVPLTGEVIADNRLVVNFYDGTTICKTAKVQSGNTVLRPADLIGCDGTTFLYWTAEETIVDEHTAPAPFDFENTPITTALNLRAVYASGEPYWTVLNSYADVTEGTYIILSTDRTKAFTGAINSSNGAETTTAVDLTQAIAHADACELDFQAVKDESDNVLGYRMCDTKNTRYLYSYYNKSRKLAWSTGTQQDTWYWKIGAEYIQYNNSTTLYLRYNGDVNSNPFRAYASATTNSPVVLARKGAGYTYSLTSPCMPEMYIPSLSPVISAKDVAITYTATITTERIYTQPDALALTITGADKDLFTITVSDWAQHDFTYTATYTVTYQPITSGPATHTIDATITSGTFTTTIPITGYTLPDRFVIASHNGTEWTTLAIPTDATKAGMFAGGAVIVDDTDNPTKATSLKAEAIYDLRNVHADNAATSFGRVRLHNLETNGYLWSNMAASANNNIKIDSKTTDSPEANYEWIVTSDNGTDFTIYHPTRQYYLGLQDNQWGVYPEKTTVRFLPYELPTQPLEVVDWGKYGETTGVTLNLINLMYDAIHISDHKGNILAAPTLNADGTHTFPITSLNTKKCTDLTILLKDADNLLTSSTTLRIPIIVAADKSTADAFGDLTAEVCATCDLVVKTNEGSDPTVLTHTAQTTIAEIRDLYVYPNAQIKLNTTLAARSLTLRSTHDLMPQVACRNATDFTVSQSLQFTKRITDDSRYYFFSLPYDCPISNITFSDGTPCKLDENLAILYYDGNQRLSNGGQASNWKSLTADATLQAGQGYAIGVTGNKEVIFPMQPTTSNLQADEANAKEIAVTAHGITDGYAPNNVGWNFVGNPYLSTYQAGSETGDATLQTGSLHLQENGEYIVQDETTLYLTIPDAGTDQTYHQVLASTNAVSPFSAFFIQASATGSLVYAPEQVNPMLLTPHSASRTTHPAQPIYAGINLTDGKKTDGKKTDETSLVINDRFTQAYEIGSDLEKMLGLADKPQVYIHDNTYRYAFKALNEQDAATANPLGVYLPAQEATTYTFHAMRTYDLSPVQAIYLTDHVAAKTVNLLDAPYSFTHTQDHNTTRFALSVVLKPEVVTSLTDITTTWNAWQDAPLHLTLQGLTIGDDIRVMDAVGRLIHQFPVTAAVMQCHLPTAGVYCIQTIGTNGLQLKKIIIR